MKVSIICPTYNRPEYHGSIYRMFNQQKYSDKELLIIDDSTQPSLFFNQLQDDRVIYHHLTTKTSIGEKRNLLINLSQGEIIAHFDDDDYYAPHYIQTMVNLLNEADLIKISNWIAWQKIGNNFWQSDSNLFSSELFKVTGLGEITKITIASSPNHSSSARFLWGYGFSYVYKKSLGEAINFQDRNHGEDFLFIEEALRLNKICLHTALHPYLVLHTLHPKSSSLIYAQKKLNSKTIFKIFGKELVNWINITQKSLSF